MQYRTIGSTTVSRFGMGTKRLPRTDVTRVDRLDVDASREILKAALSCGVNHKGESESFLGDELSTEERQTAIQTSFFELVDPRYDYVFQKQLKKLRRPCIDLCTVEGTCDLTRMRDIDSGAVDFLFARKEAGEINQPGFSSELSAQNLREHLKLYPWDFVRMRVNFFDWFEKGAREQYEVISEAGIPIIAHAALGMGPRDHLRSEAYAVLKEAFPQRQEIEWGLLFVKSLENVCAVTCNTHSVAQLRQDCAVFDDDETLGADELELLVRAAAAQRAVVPGKRHS